MFSTKKQIMQLTTGKTAIDFRVNDIYGNEVQLSNYKGKKIVVSFFRNVTCPFCNVRIHKLMSNSVKLERAGIQMILFFESTAEQIKSSVLHQGIQPWPVIPDPQKVWYNRYGVETSFLKSMRTFVSSNVIGTLKEAKALDYPKQVDPDMTKDLIPADFFISPSFTIEKAHYGKHIDDHVSLEELKQFAGITY